MVRGIRLGQWLTDYGRLVERISGLLRDLVGLVAEFSVPLEHQWAPLPLALRRGSCDCMTAPSKSAIWCSCRLWKYQHFCSIYTMEECGTLEFNLRVQQLPAQRWWAGILWCSETDGFQDPRSTRSNNGHLDSLNELGQLYSSVVDHTGAVENLVKDSRGDLESDTSDTRSLALDVFRGSGTTIGVRLVTVESGYAIEFGIDGLTTTTLYVKHALVSGLIARPFVQLEVSSNVLFPTCFITIETPLHQSRAS